MLAYLSWHRAAAGIEPRAYEDALAHFHRSLAHRPPSGFRGSAAFRLSELPWLVPADGIDAAAGNVGADGTAGAGYEDWYLLDDWAAVGVLEEAAVAHGHATAHHEIAARAGRATGSVYRLVEGHARQARAHAAADSDAADVAVWVTHAPGHEHPSLGALLGDGMDRERDGLWRRCLGLGPAPEFCLLACEPSAGVAASRLPAGWVAQPIERAAVWDG
jgi:hypothetical protein